MTPAQLERAFLPFEQVGDARRMVEGTGLGLSISRKLVQVMGSELLVQSAPGQGSVFWFEVELPLAETAARRARALERDIVGYEATQERQLKVLVVDDKPHNRAVLVELLAPLGFVMVEAEDGQQGVQQAQATRPDLIITDLVMPVMTGVEAVQVIRQTPELQDAVIFATSASVFEQDKQASLLAGCDAFVPKPVNARQLLALLENHLKLEWVYAPETRKPEQLDAPLAAPPQAELRVLFELAQMGNLLELEERALQLERRAAQFAPFARRLRQMAADFQDAQIIAFIEQHLDEEE
jgi:CheY-like chemotaxis protein